MKVDADIFIDGKRVLCYDLPSCMDEREWAAPLPCKGDRFEAEVVDLDNYESSRVTVRVVDRLVSYETRTETRGCYSEDVSVCAITLMCSTNLEDT